MPHCLLDQTTQASPATVLCNLEVAAVAQANLMCGVCLQVPCMDCVVPHSGMMRLYEQGYYDEVPRVPDPSPERQGDAIIPLDIDLSRIGIRVRALCVYLLQNCCWAMHSCLCRMLADWAAFWCMTSTHTDVFHCRPVLLHLIRLSGIPA